MLLIFVNVYWLRRGKGRREKREEKKTGGKGEREKEEKKMSSHRFMLNYLNMVDGEEKKERRREKKNLV